LSSELSSAHGAKQRHSHRFLIPGDPALTIGYVKGGEAINVVTPKTPFSQPIEKSDSGALSDNARRLRHPAPVIAGSGENCLMGKRAQ
jgi:hypothetical protein